MEIIQQFKELLQFVETSLDLFRPDLSQLLFPVLVHTYLDHLTMPNIASILECQDLFPHYVNDLGELGSITSPLYFNTPIVIKYKSQKATIVVSKYAFDLFMAYLEERNLTYFIKVLNQHVDLKTGLYQPNTDTVVLKTDIVCKESEESVLNDDRFKFDNIEQIAQSFKKNRSNQSAGSNVSASQIVADMNKMSDFTKKVSVDKDNPANICCYTVHNTYNNLTSCCLSNDLKIAALGYQNSVIEIHSLSEELEILKTSVELSTGSGLSDAFKSAGYTFKLVGHTGAVYGLRFTTCYLVSSSYDCTVRLWCLRTFKCINIYKTHAFPVWCVDINSNFIASGSADRLCVIHPIDSKKAVRLFANSLSDVFCVRFHPNGIYIFVGSAEGRVRMIEIENAKVVRVFNVGVPNVLEVSNCGRLLAIGSRDGKVSVLDIQTGRILTGFSITGSVYSLSFCWFGSSIAACGIEGIVVYDISEKCMLGKYYTKSTPLMDVKFGYRNIISTIGFFKP